MPIDFPNSPANGATFSTGDKTWQFDGVSWVLVASNASIGNSAITEAKIADGAVTSAKIAAGAVVEADLGTGAVTADKIGALAVTTGKIDSNAVTAGKIASNAVTEAKIDASAVTSAKIAAGAVVEAGIAANAVTVGKLGTDVQLGYRNVVINGAMQVHQRATSVASITTEAYYTADRFFMAISSLGTWTQTVENDAPTGSGFRKSLKLNCTTADASPAANDYLVVGQKIEGQNLQQFLKGTASAKKFTLTFWVKGSTTGTYIAELYDNDNGRQVSKSYTIDTANTWEKKTIDFGADTTGAFDNDNALSLVLQWWLGGGSTFTSGTLNTSWASNTNANRAVGQTNLAGATSRSWQVTGVQLEAGSVATPFEFEDFSTTYNKCLRYFSMSYGYGTAWPAYPAGYYNAEFNTSTDPGVLGGPWFPQPMRTAPTMTLYNAVSGLVGIYRATDAANVTGNSFPRIGNTAAGVIQLGASSANLYYYHWAASAEL